MNINLLFLCLIPVTAIIGSVILLIYGLSGWGWLMFIAVLSMPSYEENRKSK